MPKQDHHKDVWSPPAPTRPERDRAGDAVMVSLRLTTKAMAGWIGGPSESRSRPICRRALEQARGVRRCFLAQERTSRFIRMQAYQGRCKYSTHVQQTPHQETPSRKGKASRLFSTLRVEGRSFPSACLLWPVRAAMHRPAEIQAEIFNSSEGQAIAAIMITA